MCLAPNYSVVVCGKVNGQSRRSGNSPQATMNMVTRYSLTTGTEILRDIFPTEQTPSGMTTVTVAGTQYLAFSYQ